MAACSPGPSGVCSSHSAWHGGQLASGVLLRLCAIQLFNLVLARIVFLCRPWRTPANGRIHPVQCVCWRLQTVLLLGWFRVCCGDMPLGVVGRVLLTRVRIGRCSLCCICAASIPPNAANMCMNCLAANVDVTEGACARGVWRASRRRRSCGGCRYPEAAGRDVLQVVRALSAAAAQLD